MRVSGCSCGTCAPCRRRASNLAYKARNRQAIRDKMRVYHEANAAEINQRRRLRRKVLFQDQERAERARTQKREWAARTQYDKSRPREKISARRKLQDAVKAGKITRGPCVVCGVPETEAHHEDYSLPLDVVWLCRAHHAELGRVY